MFRRIGVGRVTIDMRAESMCHWRWTNLISESQPTASGGAPLPEPPVPTDRLHMLNRISESDLDLLYRNAVATLQPSWEEGFGLPVLEAMIRGCPVVTSNCSATKEVAEAAAILVDPAEPSQSRAAIEHLMSDPVYRSELISRGRARSHEYTWDKYFEKLLGVYRQLLIRKSVAHSSAVGSVF